MNPRSVPKPVPEPELELGRTWLDRRRDVVAWRISNWVLNHVATDAYRARIYGLILIGIQYVAGESTNTEHTEQTVQP